jgi:hypothetical protein
MAQMHPPRSTESVRVLRELFEHNRKVLGTPVLGTVSMEARLSDDFDGDPKEVRNLLQYYI